MFGFRQSQPALRITLRRRGKTPRRWKSRRAGGRALRYVVSRRSRQEWEQGRRRPESAVRAYLTVMDRNPEAVEKTLMNKS